MAGKKFARMMEVTCYEDADGNPTCAIDFETGDVCTFYRSYGYGRTCVFAKKDFNGRSQNMKRRENSEGTLIPLENCPVWNKWRI